MRQPTGVYDTFWHFAAERQAVFWRRFRGQPPPWTDDPILRCYRFTNCYRAVDRTSQFLIRRVIDAGRQEPTELFFRTVLFKLFNRISTWQALEARLGQPMVSSFSVRSYAAALDDIRRTQPIYSAAYIMPTDRSGRSKHVVHLDLLRRMIDDRVPAKLQRAMSMADAYRILRAYPLLGDFLAFQYLIDLNYSRLLDFSEMDFVVAGPGAKEGIARCFVLDRATSFAEIIRRVAERQDDEFEQRRLRFEKLGGRSLQLVDIQNIFCEVAKYARLAHRNSLRTGQRHRLKRKYEPSSEKMEYWFPPKWGINDRVNRQKEDRRQ